MNYQGHFLYMFIYK